jgi:hypothetical protein
MNIICTTCKTEKDISMFHKCSTQPNGVRRICKECRSKTTKIYRNNPIAIKKRIDNYNKNHKKYLEYYKEYHRLNREENNNYSKEYSKEHYKKNKIKYAQRYWSDKKKWLIRSKSRYMIKTGQIKKINNCELCGKKGTEMHHYSYIDPRCVYFVCKFHHGYIHSIMGSREA